MMRSTSTITCPACGAQATETMPTAACQIRSVCAQCGAHLRPTPGDCCVFCSYGSVPCPPLQEENAAVGKSQEAGMMDTAGDTLAADTAEAEAMSQSFEEDERVWQGIHANDAAPMTERKGAERTRRTQLPLADSLREAIATSRTLLDHAEQT